MTIGLTIILVATDDARVRAALTLAISQAALGGRSRLYAHEGAVAALIATAEDDGPSPTLAAAGLPDRCALLAMAAAHGVMLIACQTGLAMAGLTIDCLASGVAAGGLIGVLADLGDDRLVML